MWSPSWCSPSLPSENQNSDNPQRAKVLWHSSKLDIETMRLRRPSKQKQKGRDSPYSHITFYSSSHELGLLCRGKRYQQLCASLMYSESHEKGCRVTGSTEPRFHRWLTPGKRSILPRRHVTWEFDSEHSARHARCWVSVGTGRTSETMHYAGQVVMGAEPWNCYKVLDGSLQKLHHILLVKEIKAAMK